MMNDDDLKQYIHRVVLIIPCYLPRKYKDLAISVDFGYMPKSWPNLTYFCNYQPVFGNFGLNQNNGDSSFGSPCVNHVLNMNSNMCEKKKQSLMSSLSQYYLCTVCLKSEFTAST